VSITALLKPVSVLTAQKEGERSSNNFFGTHFNLAFPSNSSLFWRILSIQPSTLNNGTSFWLLQFRLETLV
jgi:hypothetical protein